jgi:hypothetical protein
MAEEADSASNRLSNIGNMFIVASVRLKEEAGRSRSWYIKTPSFSSTTRKSVLDTVCGRMFNSRADC